MSNYAHTKVDYISILGALYIILEPIMSIYGWFGLSFAKIFSYIVVFLYIIKRFVKQEQGNALPRYLLIYFVWLFIGNYLSFGKIIPLGNILQFLLFLSIFYIVKIDSFLKIYRNVAYIFIAFFILQELSFYITGHRIVGILEWLPICFGGADFDINHYLLYQEVGDRSASFFSEPAHFAQFLLPLLSIELLKLKDLRSAIFPSIIIIVLLLLRSGNGMVGLGCVFVMYFVSVVRQNKLKSKLIMGLFLVAISSSLYFYAKSDMGNSLLERSDTMTGEVGTSSGFLRTFRGYYIYDEYNLLEKITGINNMDIIKSKRDQCDVSWTFLNDNDMYVNCIQDILLRTGVIGAIIFLMLFWSIWRHNTLSGRTILITFILLSFIASLYMSSAMMLYLYLAYFLKPSKQNSCNHQQIAIS